MSEFVKKNLMGYKTVLGGHSDPECSHVILTIGEYNNLLREKKQADQKASNIQAVAETEIGRLKKENEDKIEIVKKQAERRIESIEQELIAEKQESMYQKSLNQNLLRISRERANTDRKLKPKKEHTGYVVISSSEKEYSYKDDHKRWYKVILWESVLQSPYSVDFTEEQARKQILEDLYCEDKNGVWFIEKIGINKNYEEGYSELVQDQQWYNEWQRYNFMLERHVRANFRAGYWEIVFLHNMPLGIVPKEMRVR